MLLLRNPQTDHSGAIKLTAVPNRPGLLKDSSRRVMRQLPAHCWVERRIAPAPQQALFRIRRWWPPWNGCDQPEHRLSQLDREGCRRGRGHESGGGSIFRDRSATRAANVPAPVPTSGASSSTRSLRAISEGEDAPAKASSTLVPRSAGWAANRRMAMPKAGTAIPIDAE